MSSTSVARKYQPFKVAPSNGYIHDAPVPAEVKIHEISKISTGVTCSVAVNYVLTTPKRTKPQENADYGSSTNQFLCELNFCNLKNSIVKYPLLTKERI